MNIDMSIEVLKNELKTHEQGSIVYDAIKSIIEFVESSNVKSDEKSYNNKEIYDTAEINIKTIPTLPSSRNHVLHNVERVHINQDPKNSYQKWMKNYLNSNIAPAKKNKCNDKV